MNRSTSPIPSDQQLNELTDLELSRLLIELETAGKLAKQSNIKPQRRSSKHPLKLWPDDGIVEAIPTVSCKTYTNRRDKKILIAYAELKAFPCESNRDEFRHVAGLYKVPLSPNVTAAVQFNALKYASSRIDWYTMMLNIKRGVVA
ncbi:MAG: hypothetical protein ACXABY_21235 [Candidatus Thorarchaeota archaeon]|jgi:hypothetical protein